MTTTETTGYVSPRVRQMRKFYAEHAAVRERAEPTQVGSVIAVEDDGLLRVQWSRRIGLHTEDEVEAVHQRGGRNNVRLPGMLDAFADVRGFLPVFDDEPDAFDHDD